jgi:hypothetical protein
MYLGTIPTELSSLWLIQCLPALIGLDLGAA